MSKWDELLSGYAFLLLLTTYILNDELSETNILNAFEISPLLNMAETGNEIKNY